MTDEQVDRIVAILRNIHFALVFNVGLGIVVGVGVAAISIAVAINGVTAKIEAHR